MLQDVPTVLGGRYRVLERLGRGGMADVYRAEDVVLGRTVAIKVFRGGLEREVHLARFRTEVRTLAALTHPHLVALYDAGGDVAEPWCAMEYVNGGSLSDREGGMEPGPAARVGEHIASALTYVHGQGIVHRDVKPSNVLLDRGGAAFLSDFGIARLTDGTRMTQSGLMIGTAAFLSPEQVRGLEAGPESDLYALGLVLLELLTGEREYPGTPVESAVARLSRPPRVPERFGADWVQLLTDLTLEAAADRPDAETATLRLRAIADRAALTSPTGSPQLADPDGEAHAGARGTGPDGSAGAEGAGAPGAGGESAGVGAAALAGTTPDGPTGPLGAAGGGRRVWQLRVPRRTLTAVGAGSLLAASGLVAVVMVGGVDLPLLTTPIAVPSSPTTVDPTSAGIGPSGGGLAGDPVEARRLPVGPLSASTSVRPVAPLPPAPRFVPATAPVSAASTSKKPSPTASSVSTSPSPSLTASASPTPSVTTPAPSSPAGTTPAVTTTTSASTAVTLPPATGTPTATASR